jgi:hypothetical protein
MSHNMQRAVMYSNSPLFLLSTKYPLYFFKQAVYVCNWRSLMAKRKRPQKRILFILEVTIKGTVVKKNVIRKVG